MMSCSNVVHLVSDPIDGSVTPGHGNWHLWFISQDGKQGGPVVGCQYITEKDSNHSENKIFKLLLV